MNVLIALFFCSCISKTLQTIDKIRYIRAAAIAALLVSILYPHLFALRSYSAGGV